MPLVIIHQVTKYTQELHQNIPSDWIIHSTPSGYIDRDGWLMDMTHFSTICGATNLNNQILFFDGHDNHFDYRDMRILNFLHVQHFV